MKIVWVIIGTIYLIITVMSFLLAYKSRKKQNLEDIQLNELPTEPYEPKKNVGFYISAKITIKPFIGVGILLCFLFS